MTAAIAMAWPYPRLIAHRGAGKVAPENTLTSMRVGYAHGYHRLGREIEVRLKPGVEWRVHEHVSQAVMSAAQQ